MAQSMILAQEVTGGYVLVGWWAALVLLLPFLPWAWMVSKVFDKHAVKFFLGREKWAGIHSAFGLSALAAGFLMPISSPWGFLAGFAAVVLLLGADIGLFVAVTNKDENVPEHAKLRLDFSKLAEARKAREEAKLAGTVTLAIKTPSGGTLPPPQKETPEYELRAAAEEIFIKAQDARATRIEIGPTAREGVYGLVFLVNGVKQPAEQLPAKRAVALMDFWKAAAGLDVSDRRRKQTGDTTVTRFDESLKVRVTTQGFGGGVRATLVLDPENAVRRPLNDLGLLPGQIEALNETGERGVVLLAAGKIQGSTTTLYAFTGNHDAYTRNVQTIESEPQAVLEGIRQVTYKPGEGEYSTTVRTILRRDPDVVAVAELPDAQTAQEIARADSERTRIYLSLRAEGALAAVQQYVKAVGDAEQAAKGLTGVAAQKLMRRLCDNCRVPYQPPPAMLQKLGVPAGKVKQLYKKGGQVLIRNKPETCPVCGGDGYTGQVAAFEFYPIGPDERAFVREGDWNGLRASWKKRGLPSLQQAAVLKAIEGATSVEEISRVMAPPTKKSATAEQRPAKSGAGDAT